MGMDRPDRHSEHLGGLFLVQVEQKAQHDGLALAAGSLASCEASTSRSNDGSPGVSGGLPAGSGWRRTTSNARFTATRVTHAAAYGSMSFHRA